MQLVSSVELQPRTLINEDSVLRLREDFFSRVVRGKLTSGKFT
jgi:hypothetical protein